MLAMKPYQRAHAVEYAKTWALARNPLFSRFDAFGGDCTNFISQCIFAGCCVMNETPTFGWYYRAPGDYAPAWTGVPYLYNFLTDNMDVGPFGTEIPVESAEMGDIIQLGRRDGTYYHTLIVTGMRDGVPLICAHDNDALDRPLNTYTYDRARCVHIGGVRFSIPATDCCFDGMLSGTSIFPDAQATAALSCFPLRTETDNAEMPIPDISDAPPAQMPSDSDPVEPTPTEQPRPADLLPEDFAAQTPDASVLSELSDA